MTYAAELRPEKQSRAESITLQAIDDFIRLTHSAAPAVPDLTEDLQGTYYQINSSTIKMNYFSRRWHLRRWEGRVISILRLMKAVFTFKNSVDYAAWKIKRHTGIVIKVTPVLQRHPILFGFKILWQLIRQNAIR